MWRDVVAEALILRYERSDRLLGALANSWRVDVSSNEDIPLSSATQETCYESGRYDDNNAANDGSDNGPQ